MARSRRPTQFNTQGLMNQFADQQTGEANANAEPRGIFDPSTDPLGIGLQGRAREAGQTRTGRAEATRTGRRTGLVGTGRCWRARAIAQRAVWKFPAAAALQPGRHAVAELALPEAMMPNTAESIAILRRR